MGCALLLHHLPKAEQQVRIYLYFTSSPAAGIQDSSELKDWDLVHVYPQAQPSAASVRKGLAHSQLLPEVMKHIYRKPAANRLQATGFQGRTRRDATLQAICLQQHARVNIDLDHKAALSAMQTAQSAAIQLRQHRQAAAAQGPASVTWLQSKHRQLCAKQLAAGELYDSAAQSWQQQTLASQSGAIALPGVLQTFLSCLADDDQHLRRAVLLQLEMSLAAPSPGQATVIRYQPGCFVCNCCSCYSCMSKGSEKLLHEELP